jgi:hypothetical protein
MENGRSRYGLLVSALGAILLAVSIFLPWYELSLTPAGAATASRVGAGLVEQYGNATLQAHLAGLQGAFAALAGHGLGSVSAHQALSDLNVILLVVAGLALLDALVPLARAANAVPAGAGGAVVLLGLLATACVLYRMVFPPVPAGGVVALSLREGAWLSLFGALMMVLGGMWPRTMPVVAPGETLGPDI